MKITDVSIYTVQRAGSDFGLGQFDDGPRGGAPLEDGTVSAHPLSIFPEYKNVEIDHRTFGPAAYAPFVVELHADNGVSGFAVNHGGGEIAARLVRDQFSSFLVGQNPFDSNRIWEQMYRSQLATSQGGLAYMAISAIDLALWDLKAKLLDKPVCELIGGRTKEALPCYVTTFPSVMEHMAGHGFAGVKIASPWGVADGRRGLDRIEQMVVEAKDIFGGDTTLMIECFMSWDLDFATKAARRLKRYGIDWIEDPLLADSSTAKYREVRDSIRPTRLAVGNLMWGYNRFYSLITEGAVDVIQPELQWSGGLTEALRIAAIARGRGIPIIAHTCGVYSYHFTMANIDAPIAEYMAPGEGTEVRAKGHVIIGEPAPKDGYIHLSDEPGFGIELERSLLIPLQERSHD